MKKRAPKKFARRFAEHTDGEDALGTVRVYVRLVGPDGGWAKENRSRSFSVPRAKVSEVADSIDAALFE